MDPVKMSEILFWMAGIIVVLLSAILGFMVAWQVRQDGRVSQIMEMQGRLCERVNDLEAYIKHNIPDLYAKWDRVLTERFGKPPTEAIKKPGTGG